MTALDARFREAVAAMDAGDLAGLERLLAEYPELVQERLEAPGAWLRDQVGGALDGFFARPWLLWFVAEDPVRSGRLPSNIAAAADLIIAAVRRETPGTLQEQVDYALRLVAWSPTAAECGVQLALIDVLMNAGASPDGRPEDALVNRNAAAAEHLIARGASLSLASALCLGRWSDADRLAAAAGPRQLQFAFILAALNGLADAVRRALALGADLGAPSPDLYPHATAVHHAVCSGSLGTVQVLVEAGADLARRDTVWGGTPLGWAEYYADHHRADPKHARYWEIAEYLRRRP